MLLTAKIFNRDFTPMSMGTHTLETTSYSWQAIGGPDQCNITVWGNQHDVWQTTEWLRCPVEIYDEHNNITWWGYIDKVTVRVGVVSISLSLDTMNNKVAVAYTTPGADARSTTTWAIDADSVERYGTRELLLSMSSGASAAADILRDTQLEERKWPTPRIDHTPNANALSATLECKGWWNTLEWQYYSNFIGEESYTFEGLGTQYFGDSTSTMEVRQTFRCPPEVVDAWTACTVALKMRKANSPSDPVWVIINASTLEPLTTGSLAPSSIGPNHAWLEFNLDPPITIYPNYTYYIYVHGPHEPDPGNYYVVNINEELSYPRGEFTIYTSASFTAASNQCSASHVQPGGWYSRCPDADMEFKVYGLEETTRQLSLAASRGGQFFSAIEISLSSSVYSNPYQNGDRTAMNVVESLLEMGTKNQLRLLATVDRYRRLIITEDVPYISHVTEPYILNGKGELTFRGSPVQYVCPVGQWCILRDIVPADINLSLVFDPARFYIERSTFNSQDHSIRLESRGDAELFAVVKGG